MLRTEVRTTALLKSTTSRSGFSNRNGCAELGPSMMTSSVPCPRWTRTSRMVVGASERLTALGCAAPCEECSAGRVAVATEAGGCGAVSLTTDAGASGVRWGGLSASDCTGLGAGTKLFAGAEAEDLSAVEMAEGASAELVPPPVSRICTPSLTSFTSAVTCSPSSNSMRVTSLPEALV